MAASGANSRRPTSTRSPICRSCRICWQRAATQPLTSPQSCTATGWGCCAGCGRIRMATWELNDADRALIAREVEPFLPDRVFDAHAHLFCAEHYAPAVRPAHQEGNPEQLGLD